MGPSGDSGIAAGPDDRLWADGGFGSLHHIDPVTLAVGDLDAGLSGVKGISLDSGGFVWAVDRQQAYKVDPAGGQIVASYGGLDGPYTYSDMTGWAVQNKVGCVPPPPREHFHKSSTQGVPSPLTSQPRLREVPYRSTEQTPTHWLGGPSAQGAPATPGRARDRTPSWYCVDVGSLARIVCPLALSACGLVGGDGGGGAATATESGETDSASATATDGTDSGGGDSSSATAASTGAIGSTSSSDGTAGSTGDPTVTDVGNPDDCANLPPIEPDWLMSYQDLLVEQLTGEADLSPGLRIPNRYDGSYRDAARDFLRQEFDELGLSGQIHSYSDSDGNVYAGLESTSPDASDEVVVLGAHFDTVRNCAGANDNATGVAAVLAVARHVSEVPCRTRKFLFVLFDEEERGLIGSEAFAEWLQDQNYSVHSVHTIDQMGWDEDGDQNIELERPDDGLYAYYQAVAEDEGFGMTLVETPTGSTDHVAFRRAGFEAIGITEEFISGDTTPYYHRPSDTYDTVNFSYLAHTTSFLNAVFARLAQG